MRFEREDSNRKIWIEISSGMHPSGEVWLVHSNLDAESAEFGNYYVPTSGLKRLEEKLQNWAEINGFKRVTDEGPIN